MLTNQYKFDKYNGTGMTLGAVSKVELFNLRIIITCEATIKKFYEKSKLVDERIYDNETENQELASLRDFLLPLLINEQVGFKEEE